MEVFFLLILVGWLSCDVSGLFCKVWYEVVLMSLLNLFLYGKRNFIGLVISILFFVM